MITGKPVYSPIPVMSKDEIESVITEGNPDDVGIAVLSAALYSNDGPWAEAICHALADHASPQVRGNVFTALGHIARLNEKMDWTKAIKILKAGITDKDDFARGNAVDGLDDVKHYRKFSVK